MHRGGSQLPQLIPCSQTPETTDYRFSSKLGGLPVSAFPQRPMPASIIGRFFLFGIGRNPNTDSLDNRTPKGDSEGLPVRLSSLSQHPEHCLEPRAPRRLRFNDVGLVSPLRPQAPFPIPRRQFGQLAGVAKPPGRSLSGGPIQGHARLLTVARQSAAGNAKAPNYCASALAGSESGAHLILKRMS
jgi:hypothetical protein